MSGPLLLLAGGGTGGHVIPAIATAEEAVRRGARVRFVGTRDRLEAELVPRAGFEIYFVHVRPLVGGTLSRKAAGAFSLPVSVFKAAALLRRLKPDAVMGVGGYVAGPVVFAARMLGIRTALLEQNAAVGLTNRLLSRVVHRAFVSYEETLSYFPKGRAIWTGNPVKSAILEAARIPRSAGGKVRVLVMGGSQGAKSIDERIPAALGAAKVSKKITVLHQCGKGNEPSVRAAYDSAGIEAEVVPFIYDTAKAFQEADLVAARSGATTVAELTVMGLPALFLPYPHHKDRQQERNAAAMRDAGAAVILDENETTVEDAAEVLGRFIKDDAYRRSAAEASAGLGRGDAAARIVDELFELIGES